MRTERFWAVVPAAGKGSRMGAEIPKQYLRLGERMVLEHTLSCLVDHPRISGVMVAVSAEDRTWPELAPQFGTRVTATIGGAERCHSVLAGLDALRELAHEEDWVLVHDAARPCLRHGDIDGLLTELSTSPCGGILAIPVRDTLKRCAANRDVQATVDRTSLWHALTPQMFRLGALHEAITAALAAGRLVTDEAQAIELAGGTPRVVEGHADNIKITRPEDLALAALFLAAQTRT